MTSDTASRRKAFRFALRLLTSAAILALVLSLVGLDRAREAFAAVDLSSWTLAFLGFLALHVASAFKWRHFVLLAGAELPKNSVARWHFTGLFANLFLPTMVGGDFVRASLALTGREAKTSIVLGSLLDRLSDLVGLGLLALLGLLGTLQVATELSSAARLAIVLVLSGLALGVVLGLIILFRVPLRRWPKRIRKLVVRLRRSFALVLNRRGTAVLLVLSSTLIQALILTLNVGLGASMGLELPFVGWLFAWPLAKLVAFLPLGFNGLGVREGTFAGLIQAYAAPFALGLAQGLVWQSILFAAGVVGGVWMALHHARGSRT